MALILEISGTLPRDILFTHTNSCITFDSALTGKRNASVPFPSLTHGRFFHRPVFTSRPPAGTMQCRWGWNASALPHVCSRAVMPICMPCLLAKAASVSHAARNSAA